MKNKRPYKIKDGWLEWLPHNGVGSIGIPLKSGTSERVAKEIEKIGCVSEQTRKECFLT